MSETKNEVYLRGRAGKDAETRFTPNGKQVSKFSLATGGGKDKQGKEYPADWHNIESWNSEFAASVKKGQEVELWGRIKYDSWDDRATGQKKYMTKIVATKFGGEQQLPSADRHDFARPETQQEVVNANTPITDDDLPF